LCEKVCHLFQNVDIRLLDIIVAIEDKIIPMGVVNLKISVDFFVCLFSQIVIQLDIIIFCFFNTIFSIQYNNNLKVFLCF